MTNFAVVGQSVHRKDAIGVRIRDLPIPPEQILCALAEKDGAPVTKD
jgi:hypothetical protein